MRTGRPRLQNVERHPNGSIKRTGKFKRTSERIADAQRAAEESEMAVVLAQPHRRGNRSQLMESPFGRFCVFNDLDRELFDAGEAYASMRRQYQSAVNCPMPDRLGGSGADIETEQVRKWRELLGAWEREMLDAGGYLGRLSVISMTMNWPGMQPVKVHVTEAKQALVALARFQGKIGK